MNPFYDLNKRLSDIAAKGEPQALTESAKPDFLDVDKDGNRKESFKKAVKDREQKVAEADAPAPTTPKRSQFTYTIQGSDKKYGWGEKDDPLASGELDKAPTKESTGDYSAKKARAGKDIGKPGKNFEKIAKSAGERYGSKAAGERVAGAVLNKLRKGVKEDGADLRDLSQFPTTPGGAAMGNPSIANQAAKARDMKEAEQPTETVGSVIKRVLGPALVWKPGHSKMFKNTRRSRTQRVDDYVMKYVTIKGKKGKYGYLEANAGDQLAVDLKDALIQAGYPVYDNLLISGSGVSFQTRTPITTTAEAEMDEGNDFTGARLAAIKAGKNTFSVGGKNYRVTGDTSDEKMAEGSVEEGVIDKVRAMNYDRLAKRSEKKVQTAFDKMQDFDFADPERFPHEKEFSDQMDKMGQRTKKANQLRMDKMGQRTKKANQLRTEQGVAEGRIDDLMDKRREAGTLRQAEKPRARFVAGKAYGGSAQRDEPEDDDEVSSDQPTQPKKRGRPAGTGRKIGAKGPTRRSKLAYGESADGMAPGAMAGDEGEYGNEGDMAKDQIHTIVRNARQLERILSNQEDLPEWVQAKLAKIEGMMTSVSDYMQTQHERDGQEAMAEVAPPGAKAERMVKHIKKSLSKDGKLSDKDKAIAYATTWKAHKQGKVEEESTDTRDNRAEKAGRKVTKDIEYDEKKKDHIHGNKRGAEDAKAEKAGRRVAKDIEYDEKHHKVKEEGSAPAKASKGGMQFGKGIYDSVNREVEQLITEGMNISVNMSTSENGEPNKSVTVNADGADAEKLAEILKLAGLHSDDHGEEACDTCGSSPCGCEEIVDENHPNWPTNPETSGNALQYAGGVNGPKSTGQSVGAPFNRQDSRQGAMESREMGMNLYRELQVYKNK